MSIDDEFDQRMVALVGAALRIEHLAEQLVELAHGLYERAIVLAISSADRPVRTEYRVRDVPVMASDNPKMRETLNP